LNDFKSFVFLSLLRWIPRFRFLSRYFSIFYLY